MNEGGIATGWTFHLHKQQCLRGWSSFLKRSERQPLPVVIIGNGPSAICLSYFLSGHRPYVRKGAVHPNPILQRKLQDIAGSSVVEQDLEFLSEGLEGRSHNPLAVLFDALVRPDGDLGGMAESVLTWRLEPKHLIPHLVLGKGPLGGAWHSIKMMYPEYYKVHQMMTEQSLTSSGPYKGYLSLPKHRVVCFSADKKCVLEDASERRTVFNISMAFVLIGSNPNLSFLPSHGKHLALDPEQLVNSRRNPIDTDPFTYESVQEPGLYALGPLAGDSFVRFLQGGALAVTASLLKKGTLI